MYDYYFVQTANFMPYCCQNPWIRYYDTVYERDGINYLWLIKNSNEVLNKFKSKKSFKASNLSIYDFLHCILRYLISL